MAEKDRTLSLLPDQVPQPNRRERWPAADVFSGCSPHATRRQVYDALLDFGATGATDEEMGEQLHMLTGTARGRLCELTFQTDPPMARRTAAKRRGHRVFIALRV